jgi:hypothetical protein
MTLINKIEIPDKTWTDLEQDSKFLKFLREYVSLLKRNLQMVEIAGPDRYSYFTCNQPHDPRNPNWKPFKILWQLCRKHDHDFFIVKDLVEERLGRKVACECEILTDPKELKRRRLRRKGVYFGEPGRPELDVI